ncbi:O-methyltransferase [Novipirellula artificiosorum]|uniref:Putative O-methyltransferase n=1 Tax=Novipirellula artificiosorum TaxID=2528016 RepID=A0A5C6D5D7_9BACT|nr:class I SAM-dependent methyltransferase [Novipirellula artificiosorum]TWU32018.1 putative O-methyltransferase [Novipirellula artificiosorum]
MKQLTRIIPLIVALVATNSHVVTPLHGDEPSPQQAKRFPTAEELSRQILPMHPKPRDATETRMIAVMDDMQANQAQGMGNILPEDGRLMRMLVESLGAKHVVELGTSNGYSAIWFCLALRSTGGKLTTHELDPERIKLAKANFSKAGVNDLLTLVEGDAHETIKRLDGPIDFVLLDAEKEGFVDYLNQLLPKVRVGGLIIAHDSSGQADQLTDYFKAIVASESLETVLVDASKWGMCITRKMR